MEPKHDCNCSWLNLTVANRKCVGFFGGVFVLFFKLDFLQLIHIQTRVVWEAQDVGNWKLVPYVTATLQSSQHHCYPRQLTPGQV